MPCPDGKTDRDSLKSGPSCPGNRRHPSPVQVLVTGTLAQMELWVDGVKKYSESSSPTLQTSIRESAGTHRLAVLAVNTSGQAWEQAVNATVP